MLTASLWWPYWSLYIQSLGASVTLHGLLATLFNPQTEENP